MIHKRKCNMHMYINPPKKGKTTPSSPRKHRNVAWSKGLVRISASCFSVGTWMRSMFPFSTLSQEVVPHLYMFGFGVKHGGFANPNGTRAITHERYMWTLLTRVTQCVCDPKQLWATTSGNNILSFCGRLGYTWLFARRPRNKRKSQKLASTRSRFLIDSTPHKIGTRKTGSEREEDVEYQRPS
jgi:hypothetical protein